MSGPDASTSSSAPAAPGHPLREMLVIAAPTVATMTSYTLMQFVDKLLVSRIGPDPIYVGAQGNGGIAAFVPIAIAMGTLTIINTYASQNLGAGRADRAPAYAWNGLWIAAAWSLMLVPYGIALPWIFGLLGHSPEMIRLESAYGQILVFGAFLTMATRALSQFFYGLHRPMVVLTAGVIANVLNFALVYALVFGAFGLPKLGIAGSAIGTVIATGVELAIPLTVFLGPSFNAKFRTRSAWRPSIQHMRDLLRLGWPAGLMFGNEMICWAYFMVYMVGHFGEVHSTAGWIAHQWMSLSFMPAVGLSVAVNALVGKYMGMRRPDLAAQRAYLGMGLSAAYMGLCGLAFVLFPEAMIRLFIQNETPPETVAVVVGIGINLMYATAAFQLFDGIAMAVSGALRGAGDTIVPGVMTVALAWACIVGGGNAIMAYAPGLESLGPWTAAASYICLLCVFLFGRFLSGRWKKIDLLARSAAGREGSTAENNGSLANSIGVAVESAGPVDGIVPDSVSSSR